MELESTRDDGWHRVDLPADLMGFHETAPGKVNMKFIQAAGRWTVYMLFEAGGSDAMENWIRTYGPDVVTAAPGPFPHVLRAEFGQRPPAWTWLDVNTEVLCVSLIPQGMATVVIRGPSHDVETFKKGMYQEKKETDRIRVNARLHLPQQDEIHLTHHQKNALALAFTLGYYDLPHGINLRGLANRMGRSTGTVSELLRRAEGKIIASVVTKTMLQEWDKVPLKMHPGRP